RKITPQRLEQSQLHVCIAQIVKGVQPLLESLAQLLQRLAKMQGFEQIQQGQYPAGFNAQFVNRALRKLLLAAREPLAITTPGGANTFREVHRQFGWKVWIHKA